MSSISYSRHRFPPEIIQHAVWLYFRFPLSYRNVEDLLAERGVEVSYETVRRWALKFGTLYARKCAGCGRGRAAAGTSMRCSSRSAASACICGGPSMTRVRCSTFWSRPVVLLSGSRHGSRFRFHGFQDC